MAGPNSARLLPPSLVRSVLTGFQRGGAGARPSLARCLSAERVSPQSAAGRHRRPEATEEPTKSAHRRRRRSRVKLMTERVAVGPRLSDFIAPDSSGAAASPPAAATTAMVAADGDSPADTAAFGASASALHAGERPKFYMETYGCQMNVNDSEIVHAILDGAGYERTEDELAADVILANTCAIRENAETKVWHRLAQFRSVKQKRGTKRARARGERPPVVGVLGCMAERLKTKLLESDRMVDVVVGPDAYRDLPSLLHSVRPAQGSPDARGGGATLQAANVQLSLDETYSDITPVREAGDGRVSAFVSVMRGCNNMCSFCIVPFTRGRERSRPLESVVEEARQLVDQGFKEIVLLGQNVNSYHDRSGDTGDSSDSTYQPARGFSNMYRLRDGGGARFADLLAAVSDVDPELRVRFTSPHPKDFPDALLQLMSERHNICNNVHLPAQSGSTAVLKRMRRGYSREAFLELAHRVRDLIPGVALSTDIIAGFCGETEQDHEDTVSLMRTVGFEQAFMFAYSMRDRTHAAHRMQDDVPEEVKGRRLREIITAFREEATVRNQEEIGTQHVILVEGPSKRSTPDAPELVGRVDNNKRCVIPDTPVAASSRLAASPAVRLRAGDYAVVQVDAAGTTTLQATPLARTTLQEQAEL